MKIASVCNKMLQLLFVALTTNLLSAPLQAQMESEFNWTPGGVSLQWTEPTNWNNQDEDDTSTPGGTEAVVNIGAGFPVFLNDGGGGSILLLNIGNGARLDIESGFLSFGPRTAARPFSIQNSGTLNVVGDTAAIHLRDEVANFSLASINLDDDGKIRIVDGDTTINTSNVDTGNGSITLGAGSEISGSGGATLSFVKQTIEGQGNIGNNSIGLSFDADTVVDANVNGGTLTVNAAAGLELVNRNVMRATNGGTLSVRGAVENTGALIEAQDGSEVTLSDTFDITGGVLRQSGTGAFTTSGSGRLADLTLDNIDLTVANATNLTLDGAIENLGDISVNNTVNVTDLQIDDAVSLTGGGTVTLGGAFAFSRITDDNGGGVLTNVDNTIRGQGSVGNGQVQINNQAGGTIDANDSTGRLTLGPVSGSALVNRGLLTASAEGNLVFGSGEYDNAGGTIDVQDGSTITFNNGSNITGGTVQNLGTGSFDMLSTGSFTDLTTIGTINVNNSDNLKLTGTINNLGDITVNNTANVTDLQIDTAASLTGGGTVTLGGDFGTFSRITDDNGGGVLTNVDNTIRGKGSVGDGLVQIINEAGGTIDGNDDTGPLNLGASSTGTSVNRGLITASNGGSLVISSGEFDNSTGLIEPQSGSSVTVGGTSVVNGGFFNAADGSTINFGGSGQVVGARLQSDGTGKYETIAGTGVLEDVINESSITVANATNLKLAGVIENSGDIFVDNTVNVTDLQIDDAVSLSGGGTVTLGGALNSFSRITDDNGGGVLTNVDNTIRGKGSVGNGQVQINNQAGGTIDANDSTGSLTLGPVSGSALVNRGLLTASAGGNLVFGSGEYDNAGGTIDVQDGSTITFNNGSNITGGTVQNLGTGSFDMISTGSFTDLTTIGTINVNNSDNLKLTGTINNLGDITVNNTVNVTDLQIDTSASLTGGGTVTLGGDFGTFSRITDDNGGGVLTNVDNTIRGKGFVGNGQVQIINQAGGTIHANQLNQTLRVDSVGTTLDNAGLLLASDGGTLRVTDTLSNTGTLAVSTGGDLLVIGDLVTTGTLSYELESPLSFEGIQVNGSAALGGDVSVGTSLSFTPTVGETFEILRADGGITGEFDSNVFSSLEDGLTYDVQYTADTVILGVVSLLGDFDEDGDVDTDDVDFYSGNIGQAAIDGLAQLNLDEDQTVTLADHDLHITALVMDANGKGALIGDLNLDGDVDISQISFVDGQVVNVGDASRLLASLGSTSGKLYADGDLNADGDVDVSQISFVNGQVINVGDASRLLATLGQSTGNAVPASSAVPEPSGSMLVLLAAIAGCALRRKSA